MVNDLVFKDWDDGDILFSDDLNGQFSLTQAGTLKMIRHLETGATSSFTVADWDNYTWDTFINDDKYDESNSSDVIVATASGGGAVRLDIDSSASAAKTWAFDGASRDTDLTESEGNGGTVTFDAGNDEEDFSVVTASSYGTLTTTTTWTNGIMEARFRNNVRTYPGTSATSSVFLIWGGDNIFFSYNDVGNVDGVADTEGGSAGITFDASDMRLRITRNGTYIKTEYWDGTDAWQTLTESTTGGAGVAGTVAVKAERNNDGGNLTTTTSLYSWNIITDYVSTGTFISDAITAGATIIEASLVYDRTLPTDTTITPTLSADNGSNYESLTDSAVSFSNTGTQIKTKFVLATTDVTATPTLDFYGVHWDE